MDRSCSSVVALDILFLFYKCHRIGFCQNILPLLELKLLVMWEKIGEAMKNGL
jgi:hypothetical protein